MSLKYIYFIYLPLVSIKAALRSFFSESFTFLSFLPFSIDFNKSLLPFVEGGGILATGGGGGAGTNKYY